MTVFAGEVESNFPARYPDAVPELRTVVLDQTEKEIPEGVVHADVRQGLVAIVTWGPFLVPMRIAQMWKVSVDVLMATATDRVARLPTRTRTIRRKGATVRMTTGHPWVFSLITKLNTPWSRRSQGILAAIPASNVLLTAKVAGKKARRSLGLMMVLAEDLSAGDGGVSPHVWWRWGGGLNRVTDRGPDGEIDIEPAANLSAYHLFGVLTHL